MFSPWLVGSRGASFCTARYGRGQRILAFFTACIDYVTRGYLPAGKVGLQSDTLRDPHAANKRTKVEPTSVEDLVRGLQPRSVAGNVQSLLPVTKMGTRGSLKTNITLRGKNGCSVNLEAWGKEGKDESQLKRVYDEFNALLGKTVVVEKIRVEDSRAP